MDSPLDEIRGLLALEVVDDLLVLWTERLHHQVTLEAGRAKGVAAFRVQWIHQGLSANLPIDGRKIIHFTLTLAHPRLRSQLLRKKQAASRTS